MKIASILLVTSMAALAGTGGYLYARNDESAGSAQSQPAAQKHASPTELRFAAGAPQLSHIEIAPAIAFAEPLIEPLSGRVAYDENVTTRIGVSVPGRVMRIGAEPGDTVRAGQPLLWLDAPEYASAVAEVAKANADMHLKQSSLARSHELLDAGVIARKDYEAAQADQSQSAAELMRSQRRLAHLNQGRGGTDGTLILRTPIGGIVTERKVNPGAEVRPDLPDPLFVVTDPTSVWVVVDLPEKYLGSMRVGQRVAIEVDAYAGGDFTGTVAAIGAVLDPATRRVPVRCVVGNPDLRLKPEMYARVTPIASERQKLPRIPNAALVAQGLESYVFVARDPGTFAKRRVVLGLQGREHSYVKEGLAEGERVVVSGALLLNAELASAR